MPDDRLERIRRKRAERLARIQARRQEREAEQLRDQVREHATLGDKVLDVPRQFLRGAAEGALGTRIGWNELTGDTEEAAEVRASRDAVREHLGESLSPAGTAAGVVGRLGYEIGEFVLPGTALGAAAKGLKIAPKVLSAARAERAARAGDVAGATAAIAANAANAGRVANAGRAIEKGLEVTSKTAPRRIARDVALAAPLNVAKAADRENSTAGFLADVTDSETLDRVAETKLGRGAAEVAVDVLANGLGEGVMRGVRHTKATRRAARIAKIRAAREALEAGGQPAAGAAPGSSPSQAGARMTSLSESADSRQAPPSNTWETTESPSSTTLAGSPRSERTPERSFTSTIPYTPRFEVGKNDPASGRKITQPTDELKTLLALADEALPELRQALERTAFEVPGVQIFGVRAKHRRGSGAVSEEGLARIEEKRTRPDAPQPLHTMSDFLGGRVWLDDGVRPEEVIERLEQKGWRVVQDDGAFKSRAEPGRPGYRGRHLEVQAPNGLSAELQLVERRVGEVQEVGHLPYNILRTNRAPRDVFDRLQFAADRVWALADATPPHAAVPHEEVTAALGELPKHSETPTMDEAIAAIDYVERFLPWYQQRVGATRQLGGLQGREDVVLFSDGRQLPVRYRVIEADQLQASNHPETFEPNPRYPAGVQGRQYHGEAGRAAREHTILETARLRPLGLLDASVKVSGTPIVTPDGTVVAGNQRSMMLQRAGEHAPERAAAYRQLLQERAALFGVDPAEIAGMRNPVVVRELQPGQDYNLQDPAFLGELNRLSDTRGTKLKDAQTDAASRVGALQANGDALRHFGATLQPDQTLSQYLETAAGRQFVTQLAADGAIAPQEVGRYLDPATGRLTRAGKLAVEDMMYAAAVGSPEAITTAPARALQQLEHAIPSIVRANQLPGWGVQRELQQALELLAARAAASEQLPRAMKLDDFLGQGDLLGERWDEVVVALARALDGKPKTEVAELFRRYATAAEEAAAQGQADDIFGAAPATKGDVLPGVLGAEPAVAGGRPGFIGEGPEFPRGTLKVGLQGDVTVASVKGSPSQAEIDRLLETLQQNPRGKFRYRIQNASGQTIADGTSVVDFMSDLRSAGGTWQPKGAQAPISEIPENGNRGPSGMQLFGPAELGVRMMASMAGSGIGGAGGYQAGMAGEGTEEERRRRALLLAVFGAAAGAGLPMVGAGHLRGASGAARSLADAPDLAAFLTEARAGRAGVIGQGDLFGGAPAPAAVQDDLFGEAQPRRGLAGEERAARSELEKLRQQLPLAKDAAARQPIARRIAELERLVNRGEKIGAEELQHRAAAGEGDLFGNRAGAIGAQPEKIVAAAVRHPDGTVGFGPTHYFALESKGYDELSAEQLAQFEEGFLTSAGRFVDRAEAERLYVEPPTQADLDWLPEGQEYYQGSLHTGDMDDLPGFGGRSSGVIRPGESRPVSFRAARRTGAIGAQPGEGARWSPAEAWRAIEKRLVRGAVDTPTANRVLAEVKDALRAQDPELLAEAVDDAIAVGAFREGDRQGILEAAGALEGARIGAIGEMPPAGQRTPTKRTPSGAQLRYVEADGPGAARLHFDTPDGEVIAALRRQGDTVVVDFVGRPDSVAPDGSWKADRADANTMGVPVVREIIGAIRREFPGVKFLEAERISGVRAGAADQHIRKRLGAIGEQPKDVTIREEPAYEGMAGERVIFARDARGKEVGRVEFTLGAEKVWIDSVVVKRERRRQGIAAAMYDAILEAHPGMKIGHGELTEQGEQFRAAYDRARPNRTGAIGQQPKGGERFRPGAPPVTAKKGPPPGTTPAAEIDPADHTNLGKWTLDPDGEEALKREVQRVAHEQGLDPKRKITWEETRAKARALGVNPEALGHLPGRMNGAELLAIRNVVQANVERLVTIERELTGAAPADDRRELLERLRAAIEGQNDRLLGRMIRERSRAGRDLNNLRILAESTDDPVFWLARAKQQLGDRPLTDETRAELLALLNAGNKAGLAKKVADLRQRSVADKLLTLWKAGMLTAPTTHIANVTGNALMQGLEVAKDVPAALADAMLATVTGRRTKGGPGWHTAQASWRGARRGVREAVQVARHGAVADHLGKYDVRSEVSFNNVVLDFYTRAVFRGLGAQDRLFRGIALERSLEEQARVLAKEEGLRGRAFKDRVRQLRENPSDQMALQAAADAELATFQDNSIVSQAASGLRRPLGPVGEVILPFVRTPGNVAARAAEYSPLGAAAAAAELLVKATRGQVDAKVQRRVAERLGRSATGTTAILVGYYLASQGKLLAGRPTPNTAEANQFDLEGKQGNSVRVGEEWRQVQRFSPVGNLLLLGGHLYEAQHDPESTLATIGVRSVTALGQTVYEQSFLRGMDDLTGALRDERGGAKRYAEGLAGSVIPAAVGRLAQGMDPVVRDVDGPRERIMSRVPGLSDELPARVDQFGREVRREGGIPRALLDPTAARRDRTLDDPVVAELARVGAQVTRLKKKGAEARGAFQERATMDGQDLEALLLEAIESVEYQELPQLAAELVQTEPAYQGRNARELARELQRDHLESVVRRTRAAFSRERRQAAAPQ